ncbi:UNVERIFIED_ORG: glc operon protein GlcG [Pseudomonas lini]|uniref:Heme-binding protein n=1 Tax=Pseudomonas viciae TaxID=2505979 RepID=A0A4V1CAR7_9PSED|nr:heme-binding protein [Pseudomonas viciae]QBZ89844.1 heme-binding protein [Pseudomonas viciae]UZE83920.1 heme-binding protein [Pseudomonas viciae]WGO96122.1 heme-binding protein [Pseudomonas viciae]
MKTKTVLTEPDVSQLLVLARERAHQHQWAVSICVVDDGGHPLGLLRLDDASPLSAYIATEKARTAAMGRRDSKVFEDMINGGRYAFLSAPHLQGMLEGGVVIRRDGQCIGAIGVSGVKAEQDAELARLSVQTWEEAITPDT